MKAVSAAIVALAGAMILFAGIVSGGDGGTAAVLIGLIVEFTGIAAGTLEFFGTSGDWSARWVC